MDSPRNKKFAAIGFCVLSAILLAVILIVAFRDKSETPSTTQPSPDDGKTPEPIQPPPPPDDSITEESSEDAVSYLPNEFIDVSSYVEKLNNEVLAELLKALESPTFIIFKNIK